MIKDNHLLADLPLVVLHVVPVQDGQRHHQGGGDGQKGDKDRTEISRQKTENNYLEFTRSSTSEHFGFGIATTIGQGIPYDVTE